MLRVLELYSGIGGMHIALKLSGLEYEVKLAIDINTNANAVYRRNFPDTPLRESNIECLSIHGYDSLGVNTILMSPPCQPFTRQGNRLDVSDPRSKSLLYIINIIDKCDNKPEFVLVENVRCFEVSEARHELVTVLRRHHYYIQEFLISPTQLGIPNSRLRYYLIARLDQPILAVDSGRWSAAAEPLCTLCQLLLPYHVLLKVSDDAASQSSKQLNTSETSQHQQQRGHTGETAQPLTPIVLNTTETTEQLTDSDHMTEQLTGSNDMKEQLTCSNHMTEQLAGLGQTTGQLSVGSVPTPSAQLLHCHRLCGDDDTVGGSGSICSSNCTSPSMMQTLAHYLVDMVGEDERSEPLPDRIITRYGRILDIVNPASTRSCCFTKAYGKYIEGTGSVLQTANITEGSIDEITELKLDKNDASVCQQLVDRLHRMNLRYFTPTQIARIMGFPNGFVMTDVGLTRRQQYQLLGNSLNCYVVSVLLRLLTTPG